MFQNTNLIISTIPYRYDCHSSNIQHNIVTEVNKKIRLLAYGTTNTYLLDLVFLQRFYHTAQGYHIYEKGKTTY